jgi:hypothetical protein
MDEHNSRSGDDMSATKEKILYEVKDMATTTYTQLAVLTAQQIELVKKIDGFMERSAEQYDRMDVRVTNQGTDITTLQERVSRHRDEIDDLKKKSNLFDLINLAVTAIVGTIMYFIFGKTP